MRLVTIEDSRGPCAGTLIGDEVLNFRRAGKIFPGSLDIPLSVRTILEGGEDALDRARGLVAQVQGADGQALSDLRGAGALSPRAEVALGPPVPDPGIIISAGQSYRGHVIEMSRRRGINDPEMPKNPRGFLKNPNALIGPEAAIELPAAYPDHVDFEGEFAVVMGRACHAISAEEARDCIAGYTIVNDVSARDWASGKGTRDETLLGKQFPTFCPMGPALVTKDEIADPHALRLTTTLNGEVMQSEGTDDLIFSFWEIVAWYARFYLLRPGDVITSGTPGGTGHARDPKVYMRPGDRVEITVEGVGTLGNPVTAGAR